MKIIQFLPYFPPHKWWLETVAEEFSKHFVNEKYWEVLNIIFSVGQKEWINEYKKDWYTVVIIPAFDIIPNYPVPKIRKKRFRDVLKKAKTWDPDIVQTHTRFFLSTFLWWFFANTQKKKWVHVEHGSWYVKWLSLWKNIISKTYEWTLWRWTFWKCDAIVSISKANIWFIKKFTKKNIFVIYRGINFPKAKNKIKSGWKTIKIWFVWRLVKLKWVDILITAFSKILKQKKNEVKLYIIWDWEERMHLENLVKSLKIGNHVSFLGFQDNKIIQEQYLPSFDILVNPSLQEWLPTSVIEGLLAWCCVIATDVGWTKEISDKDDLILVKPNNIDDLTLWLNQAINNFYHYKQKSTELVEKKFCRKTSIKQYITLYNKLLST